VDTIFYSVAVTSNVKNTDNLYWKVHVKGTANTVEAAEAAGIKRFILVSGLGTIKSTPGSYMQTRWDMEEIVRKSKLDWTILQPSIVFGEGSEYFEAQARIIATLPIAALVGGGKLRFQPVYVVDVARACIEAAERDDKIGKSIELGGAEVFTNEQLINLIQRTIKTNRPKVSLPIWAAQINANLLNLLPKPPLTPATVEMLKFDNVCKIQNIIEQEFNFKPTLLKPYLAEHGIKIK
jgi:NADH dehydrogenase